MDSKQKSTELKTYQRRRKSPAPSDVVCPSVRVSNCPSASEKIAEEVAFHRVEEDEDGKGKGFTDSNNEIQITEKIVLLADDGDDGDDGGGGVGKVKGFVDSMHKMDGPVGFDTAESYQHTAVHLEGNELITSIQEGYDKPNPVLRDSQPSGMSKRSAAPKELPTVVDSENEEKITAKHPWKHEINGCRRSNRKRKSKMLPDTSALVNSPRICGRRRPNLLVDSSYSNAQKRTSPALPSKNQSNARRTATRRSGERIIDISDSDSEVVTPLCEVQEQPKGAMGSSDITSLEELLGSRLFFYYMEHIWSQFPEGKRNPFTHMDCMWFRLYAENERKESVLDWIKTVNVFSKNYVLVPIVLWSHWSLLIFCHFGESLESKSRAPCMLLLDSMRTLDPKRLEPVIRKFAVDIYKTENRPEKKELIRKIPLLIPKVPQQIDDKKCGYFVLYFIKLFILNAPEDFSIHEGYPYFMKEDWFTLEELDNFHSSLASVNVDY